MDLASLIEAAAPLGGGITVVVMALAIIARVVRDRTRERRDAIARADPQDLPSMLGDEVDKLQLSAEGLTKQQRFELVSETLAQREKRSQRLFLFAVLVSLLLTVVTVTGVIVGNRLPAVEPASQSIKVVELRKISVSENDLVLEIVLFNDSPKDVLLSAVRIQPVASLSETSAPPSGPLLETSAVYSLLLDERGVGELSHTNLVVPAGKHERLMILPRLGSKEADRIVSVLNKNLDLITSLTGRYSVTFEFSTGFSASQEIEMTVPLTYGEPQLIGPGVASKLSALRSRDPGAVYAHVEVLSVVGAPEFCTALRTLNSGDLSFMKEALSGPIIGPEGEVFDEQDEDSDFSDFQLMLGKAIAKSCTGL